MRQHQRSTNRGAINKGACISHCFLNYIVISLWQSHSIDAALQKEKNLQKKIIIVIGLLWIDFVWCCVITQETMGVTQGDTQPLWGTCRLHTYDTHSDKCVYVTCTTSRSDKWLYVTHRGYSTVTKVCTSYILWNTVVMNGYMSHILAHDILWWQMWIWHLWNSVMANGYVPYVWYS